MAYDSDRRLNYLDDEITSRLGAINAIARGTINIADTNAAASNTATITAVVLARSILTPLGYTHSAAAITDSIIFNSRIELTNTTTVTLTINGVTGSALTLTGGYQVVEYAA